VSDVIDIAIIGAGPAGLTAALYGARARADTVVFESALPGGQIINTDWIENYPGMPEGLNGSRMGELMHAHAEKFGAKFRTFAHVEEIVGEGGGFRITADDESSLARTVILATGATPRQLGIPGEAEYTGQTPTGEPAGTLEVQGVFEFVGVHPNSELVKDLTDLAEGGWVMVNGSMGTSYPGLYAAGDVTDTPLKQVVTAAGQGATAAFEALRYLESGVCPL
jgi:thioredoxin reductase